jgi:murein L,D-transpeptidase YcbB/YkuD
VLDGDLEPGAADAAALERAIQRFQARHGLAPDGRAGEETLEALNVPLRARISAPHRHSTRQRLDTVPAQVLQDDKCRLQP